MNHNMQVCSTWGNFHFSTFDGQFFQLPYTCNYILTTLCDSTKTDFNIQMRRQYINNLPTISSFTIKIQGAVFQLQGGNITLNQKIVDIPSYQNGISIERGTSFIKIRSKIGLTVFWDERNTLSIEISTKYRNQTCGLCGDFNGVKNNEFSEKGEPMTSQQYGLKWKMDAPNKICEDTELYTKKCVVQKTKCERLLSNPAFSRCQTLLSTDAFVEACVKDMCQCNGSQALCLCDTLSEFSRQCAHAGGKPQNWRTNYLCDKNCSFNLEHKECGNPCKDSCSNQEESQICEEHCIEGCFCPPDQVTVFKPSTFYIIAHTPSLQLVIQMVPVMQVYIVASSKKKGTMSGLCGNFNDVQADDFKTELGLKEGTAATFANMWKVMTTCPDVSNYHQDPCSMSVEKERFAKEWCSLLTEPKGVFSPCHAEVNPRPYKDRCIYDACKCARSEECMCAAVSSYAHECAAEGVLLQGWRNITCGKFSQDCPGNMVYYYSLNSCETTCRSLSGFDYTCQVSYTPVDGCACAKGTYLDDKGDCVPASSCPCYHNNQVVAPSQVISKDGTTCTCTHGKLKCLGKLQLDCPAPMYYFNCSNAGPGAKGVECQKSCQTLDSNQCMSTRCTSGCVCPEDQLADGKGGCVKEENCPCFHNGVFYQPGQTVKEDCNTCTCRSGKFQCTNKKCPSVCIIYGEGHYMTFDSLRYSFSGDCEYILAQDYCGNSLSGSFRIITENIPCGTTGTTCSRSVKLFLGNKEFVLSEEKIKVFSNNNGTEITHKIYTVGIYFVIETSNGLILHWDKKTSLKITLDPLFKVDPEQYYEICVQDTCACDTGGDCECFCTAVAAYAAACNEKGACISWRTPTICREPQ
ncbi:hypothetical protein SRHO_G00091120 [Serrasalmus rhombeus]